VVLAVEVTLFDKSWALPVLFRLHRSEKRCRKEKRPYRKLTEEARELVELLCKAYPDRRFELVGDAAYTNGTLIKKRCDNLTVIGRGRLDAALYAPPPKRKKGQMGRSRVRGQRLPSPEQQARKKNAPWKKATVIVYGKSTTVRVLVIDALWYVASGGELMRLVVVRGFPGYERDDVFVSTDESLTPGYVVETYAKRWSLEVTFHEAKASSASGPLQSHRAGCRTHRPTRSPELQPCRALARPSRPEQSRCASADDALVHPQSWRHLRRHARYPAQSLLEPETL
jgi:hypothetical protein